MSSKGIVLVTGANGFIAGRTIEAFLKAGYSVRATARSVPSTKPLTDALSAYGSQLEIVEVKDITAPDAFASAIKGVTAVAHLASPVSLMFTDPEPVLRTAVQGTVGILAAATAEPSVKSFVMLSSITAIIQRTDDPITLTEADWNGWAEALVEKLGAKTPGRVIYSASKAKAERALWAFRDEHKPAFTVTAVNPSFVSGAPMVPPRKPEDVSETNRIIWDVFAGKPLKEAGLAEAGVGDAGYVDVRDVARMLVFAVENPAVTDGQRYLLSAGWAGAQAVADILREAYPDRRDVIQEGTPGEGYLPGYAFEKQLVHDSSKAVKTLGQPLIPFDETVRSAAKAFEHLV